VDIEIARPEGFITVPVPAGEHTVMVRFEPTPVRSVSWLISAGSAVLLIACLGVWRVKLDPARTPASPKLRGPAALWMGGAVASFLVLRLIAAAPTPEGLLYLNSAPGEALPAQHEVEASFEGNVELLGYDLPQTRVKPGETFSVVLYWHALTPLEENYQSFVHLARPLDTVWGQEDHLNPGGLPTGRWPRDKYVWDEYEIYVPPETPPGTYSINVGLYLRSEGYRLKRVDEKGNVVGDSLVISSITVAESYGAR
jgi:hypothetical protein